MQDNAAEIIKSNLGRLRKRIAAACERVDRNPDSITLVAVTKYFGADIADAVAAAGAEDIGENRLQVAKPKLAAMTTRPRRHFIGPLQRNKVKSVLALFDVVHSVDRLALAQAINRQATTQELESVPCFFQVNVSGEEAKGGFEPVEIVRALADVRANMTRLQPLGLMTMAPQSDNPEKSRKHFAMLGRILGLLHSEGIALPEVTGLSMGMSSDFEVAIEEGATHLRIGSLLYEGLTR